MDIVVMGEKINPELELAINSNAYTSDSSLYLGYDKVQDEWTLIIRYYGELDAGKKSVINEITHLLGGYAIIKIYTYNILALSEFPQILYIDKASYFSYGQQIDSNNAASVSYSKYSSCLTELFSKEYELTGRGVCIGIIDSGLDIRNQEFISGGETRLLYYWNQNEDYDIQHENRYKIGRTYNHEEINNLLHSNQNVSTIYNSHGSEVASIAAGSNLGVAAEADIIMVEQKSEGDFPDTIGIMCGIDFLVRYSMDADIPMVINLSYGNNYGAHDGTGILEQFIDTLSKMAKINIVTGTGNDGNKRLNAHGMLGNISFADLNINVSNGVKNFGLQIWKNYIDNFDVLIYNPSYEIVLYLSEGQRISDGQSGVTDLYTIYEDPSPYRIRQLIYIFFQSENWIDEGIWKVRLMPKSIVNGVYSAYLPNENYITGRVELENADPFGSLTVPGTSNSIITVASYNQNDNSYTGFSGRGYTSDNRIKPDIAAPGVGITASAGPGELVQSDGTSLSTAYVSGTAALLMEWGIIRGNDLFMYGEKLKAQLIKGASQLSGNTVYPNRYIGWGTLCASRSFDFLK